MLPIFQSIPRKREESNTASEGGVSNRTPLSYQDVTGDDSRTPVSYQDCTCAGSTAASVMSRSSTTTLSEASVSVAGGAGLGASGAGVAGFSDWALVLRRSIGEVMARVMPEHRPG